MSLERKESKTKGETIHFYEHNKQPLYRMKHELIIERHIHDKNKRDKHGEVSQTTLLSSCFCTFLPYL